MDAALAAASSLARLYGAELVLLAVPKPLLPTAARFLPGTTALTRALEGDDLRRRLSELAQRLRTGDRRVRTIVGEASPADAILHAAESLPADLIVLVTHAHSGLTSWYEPSTASSCSGSRT